MNIQPPSLFTITLIAPIVITFKPPTTPGDIWQRPPLTITQLNGVVTDNGATATVQFNQGRIPLQLTLWSATSTPTYTAIHNAIVAGGVSLATACQAQAQTLIGADAPTQLAAVRSLFPSQMLV